MNLQMKRVDFENGTITSNILGASLPMLVAQILSLLYNIVDRIILHVSRTSELQHLVQSVFVSR